MQFSTWIPSPAPSDGKDQHEELWAAFEQNRPVRILVLPALFEEANTLRRFTFSLMRALDEAAIDSALPDWPGCHESLAPITAQTLSSWRACVNHAAEHFEATHIFAVRGGCLLDQTNLPSWHYAPVDGGKLLAGMMRARAIAEREAGRSETRETLLERARIDGISLAGWALGAEMVLELEAASPVQSSSKAVVDQAELDGAGLWLRAEPSEDANQTAALAKIIIDAVAPDQAIEP
ncbi:MAG: hypothetical protein AAF249_04300 [Pseudomonadota bacterium]